MNNIGNLLKSLVTKSSSNRDESKGVLADFVVLWCVNGSEESLEQLGRRSRKVSSKILADVNVGHGNNGPSVTSGLKGKKAKESEQNAKLSKSW